MRFDIDDYLTRRATRDGRFNTEVPVIKPPTMEPTPFYATVPVCFSLTEEQKKEAKNAVMEFMNFSPLFENIRFYNMSHQLKTCLGIKSKIVEDLLSYLLREVLPSELCGDIERFLLKGVAKTSIGMEVYPDPRADSWASFLDLPDTPLTIENYCPAIEPKNLPERLKVGEKCYVKVRQLSNNPRYCIFDVTPYIYAALIEGRYLRVKEAGSEILYPPGLVLPYIEDLKVSVRKLNLERYKAGDNELIYLKAAEMRIKAEFIEEDDNDDDNDQDMQRAENTILLPPSCILIRKAPGKKNAGTEGRAAYWLFQAEGEWRKGTRFDPDGKVGIYHIPNQYAEYNLCLGEEASMSDLSVDPWNVLSSSRWNMDLCESSRVISFTYDGIEDSWEEVWENLDKFLGTFGLKCEVFKEAKE